MLVLLALVVSVAAVDSLNPSTLGAALYLAIGRRGGRDVATFTAGVFAVSTLGGLILVFGPGRALLALVSKPSPHTVRLLEVVSGVLVLVVAAGLWLARDRVAKKLGGEPPSRRSAFLLGAGIMAAELPTAFPYAGGLAATVEADRGALFEVAMVLLYNVLFVAPLLVLLVALVVGGARGERLAQTARAWIERYGAVVVPAALAVVGIALVVLGLVG